MTDRYLHLRAASVQLHGRAAVLLPLLRILYQHWLPQAEHTASASTFHITCNEHGYTLALSKYAIPFCEPTTAGLCCRLSIALVEQFLQQQKNIFDLHAAAIRKEQSILLCGDHHAGKSSLVARMLANGWQSYGDDMVGLTPDGNLYSFGIPPWIRLPLPASPELAQLVQQAGCCSDPTHCYLAPEYVAPLGQQCPVNALVLLQRSPTARAQLLPVAPDSRLHPLLLRFLLRPGTARDVLQLAARLIHEIPCFLLQYDNMDDAALVLEEWHTGCPIGTTQTVHLHRTQVPARHTRLPRHLRISAAHRNRLRHADTVLWQQAPHVLCRHEGNTSYLSNAEGTAIFTLTPLAQAVWAMLEAPLSEQQASALLAEVFPHVPLAQIRKDMHRLFAQLSLHKLICPCVLADAGT